MKENRSNLPFPKRTIRSERANLLDSVSQKKINVCIFNLRYSPNLGDGVIAECLSGELQRIDSRINTFSFDLAGRKKFGGKQRLNRMLLLKLVNLLPQFLCSWLVPLVIALRVKVLSAMYWRPELPGYDAAIVGGGTLFADVQQNFPIKLAEAFDAIDKAGLPVALTSIGVTSGWSVRGLRRIRQRLKRLRLVRVSVRDQKSREIWDTLFGETTPIKINLSPDPALLSVNHYYAKSPHTKNQLFHGQRRIGLCITSPLLLDHHTKVGYNEKILAHWLKSLTNQLISHGCKVILFTNGSSEDRAFCRSVAMSLIDKSGITSMPDFHTPSELVQFIAGLDCVLAHRLHACIIAYSFRIPSVGFAWDTKMESFFFQTKRSRFLIDPLQIGPLATCELALESIKQGIEPRHHSDLLSAAREEIQSLATCIVRVNSTQRSTNNELPRILRKCSQS